MVTGTIKTLGIGIDPHDFLYVFNETEHTLIHPGKESITFTDVPSEDEIKNYSLTVFLKQLNSQRLKEVTGRPWIKQVMLCDLIQPEPMLEVDGVNYG